MSNELTPVEYEGNIVPIDFQGLPWMTQKQLSDVLGVQQSTISRNAEFAASSKLVVESSKKRNLPVYVVSAYTAEDGKTYQVTYYNVFVLIHLAMRTRSERAFNFQMWAMDKLADALVNELKRQNENLQFALSEEQKEKRLLEWKVEEYETEQERKNRDNLDLYDWNDL